MSRYSPTASAAALGTLAADAAELIAMLTHQPGSGPARWVVDEDGDWTRGGVLLGYVRPERGTPLRWSYTISKGGVCLAHSGPDYSRPDDAMLAADAAIAVLAK